MSVRLHKEMPEAMPDIGAHGYTETMNVYLNQPPDARAMADAQVTRAYAETIIANGLHRVGFSSRPDGDGVFGVMEMTPDDAGHYAVGAQVTFHFRKVKEIGFGELVAVTPLVEHAVDDEPAAPGMGG